LAWRRARFAYRPFLIKLLTEQVAGYYDPKAQQFYLADWIEIDGQKPVMAHELTHALQDQHFNLKRFDNWPKGDSDAELAAHALIEGDATLAMTLYLTKHPMIALAFIRTSQELRQHSSNKRRARCVSRCCFPIEGFAWATQVYRAAAGTWCRRRSRNCRNRPSRFMHRKVFRYEAP
jgi:hypothetical protein